MDNASYQWSGNICQDEDLMTCIRDGEDIILYHASYKEICNPDLAYAAAECDFGKAFYLTNNENVARLWACAHYGSTNPDRAPTINVYRYHVEGRRVIFLKDPEDWLFDLLCYRNVGSRIGYDKTVFNPENAYSYGSDVIIGPIADSALYRLISYYTAGKVENNLEMFHYLTSFQLGHQVAITNQDSIRDLELLGSYRMNMGNHKRIYCTISKGNEDTKKNLASILS